MWRQRCGGNKWNGRENIRQINVAKRGYICGAAEADKTANRKIRALKETKIGTTTEERRSRHRQCSKSSASRSTVRGGKAFPAPAQDTPATGVHRGNAIRTPAQKWPPPSPRWQHLRCSSLGFSALRWSSPNTHQFAVSHIPDDLQRRAMAVLADRG